MITGILIQLAVVALFAWAAIAIAIAIVMSWRDLVVSIRRKRAGLWGNPFAYTTREILNSSMGWPVEIAAIAWKWIAPKPAKPPYTGKLHYAERCAGCGCRIQPVASRHPFSYCKDCMEAGQ